MLTRKNQIFILFSISIIILTFCLGVWQIKRNIYKKELIATYEFNIDQKPIFLNVADVNSANEFRIYKLKGKFIADEYFTMGPKYKNKTPGAHLYVFFETEDGQKLLLNSGFIASSNYQDDNHDLNFPQGTVILKAMLRFKSKANKYLPENDLNNNFWFSLNKDDLKTQFDYNFENFYFALIDSKLNMPSESFPKNHIEFYDEHVPYIITWFTLSAVLIFLTLIFYRSNK